MLLEKQPNTAFTINKINGFNMVYVRFSVEEINIENSSEILDVLMNFIRKKSVRNIIFDRSCVYTMYSCGLGMLYHIKHYLESYSDGDVILVSPTANVLKTFDIIGLIEGIFIFENLHEAAQFLDGKQSINAIA